MATALVRSWPSPSRRIGQEEAVTSPILVTGGTGTLGQLVVPRLRNAGRDVRVLSRHSHASADGIESVSGDLAKDGGSKPRSREPRSSCIARAAPRATRTRRATSCGPRRVPGPRHLVFISVVGADRIPIASAVDRAMFGYFGCKLAAEQVVAGSGLPWTTLRATQFHDLILTTVRQLTRMPVVPVPVGVRFQPVDADEVAARLVELAFGAPAGLVADLAGPRVHEMRELVRDYLRARRKHRPIMPVRPPGKAARAFRDGANLAPERAVGHRTWEDFLLERVSLSGTSRSGATQRPGKQQRKRSGGRRAGLKDLLCLQGILQCAAG